MKKLILALAACAGAFAGQLHAEQLMTYQGRLKESGLPVTDVRAFSFQFCDAPENGTCFPDPATPNSFPVVNGLFKSTFPVPTDEGFNLAAGDWYLQVRAGGLALTPREKLTVLPYAIQAATASYSLSSVRKAGDIMSGPLQTSSITVTGGAFSVGGTVLSVAGGKVGVGIASPSGNLEVYDTAHNYSQLMITNPGSDTALAFKKGGVARGVLGMTYYNDSVTLTNKQAPWFGNYDPAIKLWDNGTMQLRVGTTHTIRLEGGYVAVSTMTPLYRLHVSSGAGETGIVMAVSTGPVNLFWVAGDGVHAVKYWGDGSQLQGVTVADDSHLHSAATLTGVITSTEAIILSTGVINEDLQAYKATVQDSTATLAVSTGSIQAVLDEVILSTQALFFATNESSPGTLVRRDGSGSFKTSEIEAAGTLTSPRLMLAMDVAVSSEAAKDLGAGLRVSTNVYIVGFSSAGRYYGDGSGLTGLSASNIGSGLVDNTEFGYLNGVGASIQGQIDGKLGTALPAGQLYVGNGDSLAEARAVSGDITISNTGVATLDDDTVTSPKILDGEIGNDDISPTAGIGIGKLGTGGVTGTEFDYLAGVTGGIQGQLNSKAVAADVAVDTNSLRTTLNGVILSTQSLDQATDLNIGSALVKRDASGNFSAGLITASGLTASVGGLTVNSAPNGTLDLDSGGNGDVFLGVGANAKSIVVGNETGATSVAVKTGSGNFSVNTDQLFVNKTAGRTGVLTTTPDQALTVAGNISQTGQLISSGTGSNYFAGNIGISSAAVYPLVVYSAQQYGAVLRNTYGAASAVGLISSMTAPNNAAYSNYALQGFSPVDQGFSYGVYGAAAKETAGANGRAYGVYGRAGNATDGYNYPVYGRLVGSNSGAGVFGTVSNNGDSDLALDKQYAGYFNGLVGIAGQAIVGGTVTITGNAFSVGGSTLVVDSGNIGIGTASPVNRFHVNVATGGAIAKFDASTSGDAFILVTAGTTAAELGSNRGGSQQGFVGSASNSDFEIRTNNTPKLYVKSAGNTGIGTTAPDQKLTVNGNISQTGVLISSGSGNNHFAGNMVVGGTLTVSGSAFSVGGGTLAVWNGKVGIGKNNPAEALDVAGFVMSSTGYRVNGVTVLDANQGLLAGDGNAGVPGYRFNAQGSVGLFRPASNVLGFSTNGSERMRIGSDGNVGIGSAAPDSALTVAGSISNSGIIVSSGMGGSYFASSVTVNGYGIFNGTVTINEGNLRYTGASDSAGKVLKSGGDGYVYWGLDDTAVAGMGTAGRVQMVSTEAAGAFADTPLYVSGTGQAVGLRNPAPAAPLDIISTATAADTYAQIWRRADGVAVASVSSLGRFSGNGAGLTGIVASDSTKLPLAGGILTGPFTVAGASVTVSAGSGDILALNSGATYGLQYFYNNGSTLRGVLGYSNQGSLFNHSLPGAMGMYGATGIHLGVSGEAQLTVADDENVGINTITPAYALDVSTNINSLGFVFRAGLHGIVISTGGAVQTTGLGHGGVAGSARGMGAVDLQTGRSAAGQVASGDYSVVGGGFGNTAGTAGGSVVAGGASNTASGLYSSVSGGTGNFSGAAYAYVGGGYQNRAEGSHSSVLGGGFNEVYGLGAAIAGGDYNTADGNYAFVSAGSSNTAKGNYSWAGGRLSSSTAGGAFTWSDSEGLLMDNGVADRTVFKNRGGFIVSTTTNLSNPAFQVTAGGKVGIGVSNPSYTLEVYNNAGTGELKIAGSDTVTGRLRLGYNSYIESMDVSTDSNLVFYTKLFGDAAKERVRISSEGAVGIHNPNPQAALDVVSTTTVGNVQIWRNNSGVAVATMTSSGMLYASVDVSTIAAQKMTVGGLPVETGAAAVISGGTSLGDHAVKFYSGTALIGGMRKKN